MSYLDPRAGQSGDDTGDPYADFRRDNSGFTQEPSQSWHADDQPVTADRPMAADEPEPARPKSVKGRRRANSGGRPTTERKPTTGGKGRAGRNLPAAIAVGVSLILVVLASLTIWTQAFLGVIALAAGAGVWEMSRALKQAGTEAPLIPLLAGSVLMTGLAWYAGPDALVLGLIVTVLAALVWRAADGLAGLRRDLAAIVLTAGYVPFLINFGVLLVLPLDNRDGAWRVLCTLLAVVLSDTGGYAAGVFLGRHKMAPSISPGKTWEGFGGSLVASALGSALLLYFLLDIPAYWGLLFGAVLSVVAVVGDLAESMLKRDLGVKDMSNLLPGHGGVMDRLDSILFAVPTAYFLFAVIAAS
jgi:phosphatidate cytidylyltransferase